MNIPHVGSQLSDEAELCFCKIAKVAEKKLFALLPPIPMLLCPVRIEKLSLSPFASLRHSSVLVPSTPSRTRSFAEFLEQVLPYRNRKNSHIFANILKKLKFNKFLQHEF